jgi:hypothetical protein
VVLEGALVLDGHHACHCRLDLCGRHVGEAGGQQATGVLRNKRGVVGIGGGALGLGKGGGQG